MGRFKICDYLCGDVALYKARGPINIAVIGDSVSHGCFGNGVPNDYNAVYHNRLRLMLNGKFRTIPVNIINTAIGGTTAPFALRNFDRDVLPHKPDLVIICFGLNDVGGELDTYVSGLSGLFKKCNENGFECIFMTPNMLNTYRSEETEPQHYEYAAYTAEMQRSGKMDHFMEVAKQLAADFGVAVCDCYSEWKKLSESGVDTTKLLINRINHPTREMHQLFADMLYETILGEKYDGDIIMGDDGMIKNWK